MIWVEEGLTIHPSNPGTPGFSKQVCSLQRKSEIRDMWGMESRDKERRKEEREEKEERQLPLWLYRTDVLAAEAHP